MVTIPNGRDMKWMELLMVTIVSTSHFCTPFLNFAAWWKSFMFNFVLKQSGNNILKQQKFSRSQIDFPAWRYFCSTRYFFQRVVMFVYQWNTISPKHIIRRWLSIERLAFCSDVFQVLQSCNNVVKLSALFHWHFPLLFIGNACFMASCSICWL